MDDAVGLTVIVLLPRVDRRPRTVSVRTEPLPLSGAGKVLKTVLRRELQL